MFKLFIIASCFWLASISFPPKGIDFEDKTLKKEIQKIGGTESPEWEEISFPEANSVQGKFFILAGLNKMKKYILDE